MTSDIWHFPPPSLTVLVHLLNSLPKISCEAPLAYCFPQSCQDMNKDVLTLMLTPSLTYLPLSGDLTD